METTTQLVRLKNKLTPLLRPQKTAKDFGDEILAWAKRNFPTQDTFGLGPLEEMGEWAQYILKCAQGIRKGANQSEGEKQRIREEGCLDSIADAMVYTLQLASIHGAILDFNLMDNYIKLNRSMNAWWAVGAYLVNLSQWFVRIVAVHSTVEGHPSFTEKHIWLQGLLNNLGLLSYLSGNDPILDCLIPVWDKVKTRDWVKYPTNGRSE